MHKMLRCLLFIFLLLSLLWVSIAYAQKPAPVHTIDGKYIREWLVLGPFFPDDLEVDFLADVGGEANVDPREGDTVITADGRTLTWKRSRSSNFWLELKRDAQIDQENATAYAFCVLQSEVAGTAAMHLWHDDGMAIWINGKQAHSNPVIVSSAPSFLAGDLEIGSNSCLVKVSQRVGNWWFAMQVFPPNCALVSGVITDVKGETIPDANVRLEQDGEEIARTQADSSGSYRLGIYPVRGRYDLSATDDERGDWRLDIPLHEGERRTIDFTLRETISIEGTLLMLDDATPHVAVPVQAILDGKVTTTVLSDKAGRYQFVNLKPGRYKLRCQALGGYVYYQAKDEPLPITPYDSGAGEPMGETLQVRGSRNLRNVDFRFMSFKKGTWRNYDTLDGLVHNQVLDIYRDNDGAMWFATMGGGISRYDGKEFVNFTMKDGLLNGSVRAIHRDADGVMWFATIGGVSRYDGREFVNFTTEDGLGRGEVWSVYRDKDGNLWFGTQGGGASRYDGKEFVNFTTEDGLADNRILSIYCDPDGVMWFGTNRGVSRYDGEDFVNFNTGDGLAHNFVPAIHRDTDGVMWFGTLGGVSRYDGREFVNFTTEDGLGSDHIWAVGTDPDGMMWFGTWDGGVSCYDGKGFVNFTTEDGLADNRILSIYCDPDGVMWFGTGDRGVCRYDDKAFVNLTTEDGLLGSQVLAMLRDSDGVLWFGTFYGGVSRYDGKGFVNFTTKDGLASNDVRAIYCDPDGVMWFGMNGGVSRYDGVEFANFTTEDGLASNDVRAIHCDPDGVMWFGTNRGVSRYDGEDFVNFNTGDGLAGNEVRAIYCDPDGVMWFGGVGGVGVSRYNGEEFIEFTMAGKSVQAFAIYRDPDGVMWFGGVGVSRYDGREFVKFTKEDGLAHGGARAIHRDSNGVMWFGTRGGGVSCYDSIAWTSLDTRDGLAGINVYAIDQDEDGYLWFATEGGVTRYRPSTTPPRVRIISLKTDREHKDLQAIPTIRTGERVTIKCSAIDLKTIPEKRQYRYRVKELDSDWRKPTNLEQFEWTPNKPGTYTFEVQAIDRDLNYSEPASMSIEILAIPFYKTFAFTMIIGIIGSGSLLAAILLGIQRWRLSNSEKLRLQNELQEARQMQMSLLPETAPMVEDMEIQGKTITANTVGGDFFDYLELPDGRTGIVVADVSGKGLKAAMNATMTNGMLHEVVKIEASSGRILSELNAGLYPLMERQMFTALSFVIVDQDAGVIQWSNAAQPHPLIKGSGAVSEAMEDGQLPLGMAPDVEYLDHELKLQIGDIVIFYTDGIIEAGNEADEMYGTERLMDLVAGIDSAANAERIIDVILQDVSDFAGSAQQYDDMTVVVLRKF